MDKKQGTVWLMKTFEINYLTIMRFMWQDFMKISFHVNDNVNYILVCQMCHSLGMKVYGMTRTPVSEEKKLESVDEYR